MASYKREEIVPKVLERLAEGESMFVICQTKGMPNRSTIATWADDDPELAAAIARARDLGFDQRAERAVEEAKACEDATKARLAFDADRWYLAKLNPQRYGERTQVAQTDVEGNDVEATDPIDTVTKILAAARARQGSDASDLA